MFRRIVKNLEHRPPNHGRFAARQAIKKLASAAGLGKPEVLKLKSLSELSTIGNPPFVYVKTSFNKNDKYPYYPLVCKTLEKSGYKLFNLYGIRRGRQSVLLGTDILFISESVSKKIS